MFDPRKDSGIAHGRFAVDQNETALSRNEKAQLKNLTFDRILRMFGAMQWSNDTPLASGRNDGFRLIDSPDKAHLRFVARDASRRKRLTGGGA